MLFASVRCNSINFSERLHLIWPIRFYLRFSNRKPEFNRTLRITIGVIVVNFHLRTLLMCNGIAGPFASCAANVIYGGTFGNSDGVNGHPPVG